jgi:hypothetical protein
MSLTANDLNEIRSIIESALTRQSSEVIEPLRNELQALRSDIKEIYDMLSELQKEITPDEQFSKLSLEQKLLKLNAELLAAAKQAGISLPR